MFSYHIDWAADIGLIWPEFMITHKSNLIKKSANIQHLLLHPYNLESFIHILNILKVLH
jgi:hypothetical protein